MRASTGYFLFSLLFFISAGVFFVLGEGVLATIDVVIGIVLGVWGIRRRRGEE